MKKNQQFLTATCDVNVASQMINRNLHRQGQIWTAIALIVMCMVPVGMSIIYKTTLNWKLFFTCVGLLIYYLPIGVGEVFTYSYMLGVNGTYLAFVTGNLSNLKIPCVVNAVNIVGTKVGTEEHEIACTISIAVSSIVTVVVILIGVIALAFSGLGTLLSSPQAAFLTPAFGTVAFALFGALGGKYLVKYPKVAIFPFIIMVALTIGLNLLGKGGMAQPATFIFVGVVLCFISAVLWQKHDAKKKAKQELLNLAAAESLKDSASPETISSDESAITTDTVESKDLAENNQSNND
ncbi:MAG: hypothetical protein PUG65_01410 [Firmicutes bacterium]|nr:hypothetical protein [Bacillota bacterium]MDY4558910.1 hypothetical protein [Eubacteriales bacterium]